MLRRKRFEPLPQDIVDQIKKSIEILDHLPNQEKYTKRVNKVIKFFRKGCYLRRDWSSEAFLNFYKSMELVSHDFRKDFDEETKNQMKETIFNDLTEKELKDLRTPKRLIQFTSRKLGIVHPYDAYDIPRIVELRNKFGAHANLKDVTVSKKEFNDCSVLGANIIINYLKYLETKEEDKKITTNPSF